MTHDHRKERRLRTLQSGRIVFNSASSTIDCTIRDLSGGGARLRFPEAFQPPSAFELLIGSADRRVPAQMTWQRGRDVGIAFG